MTAQVNTGITPLDPNDRRTWKNIPCPVDLSAIQAELTKVGGLNRYGKPNFIIVWGQDYKTWDCGKMRIHFDEETIDAIHTPNRWAVPPDVYERTAKWFASETERRQTAFMNLDWKGLTKYPDVGEYLAANESPLDYIKLPSDEEDLGRMARLMPEGWMYVQGLWDFEHIGQQCFFVLQYYPPEMLGKEDAWEGERFVTQYYPETDREEQYLDVTGPFPSEGSYEKPVVRIGTRRIVETKHEILVGATIDREIYTYKTPTIENVVEPLKELLQIRDSLTDDEKDPVKRNEKREKDFLEERPKAFARWRQLFRERFRDAMPVGKGNPTNISANKAKSNN